MREKRGKGDYDEVKRKSCASAQLFLDGREPIIYRNTSAIRMNVNGEFLAFVIFEQ